MAVVTLASAIFAVVTLASNILAVVTLASTIFVVVTASVARSAATIVPSFIIELSTLLVPMVLTPALSMVTSPVNVTSAATLLVFPRYIFPSAKVVIAVTSVST